MITVIGVVAAKGVPNTRYPRRDGKDSFVKDISMRKGLYMFKCIDRVVGEIIESKDRDVLLDVCGERKCDYGNRADFYQLDENTYELTYIS
jgi:hypothetical protein